MNTVYSEKEVVTRFVTASFLYLNGKIIRLEKIIEKFVA
ncbi:hypothetical protein CUZ89_1030 [Enterococcus xinjiangensis]|nr:hypothetical protein [Enterococcus lactis]